MKKIGLKISFYRDWLDLVTSCIRTVEYSVFLNGAEGEKFKPNKGLRQGDPLNPYLFFFCLEGFFSLLRTARMDGMIKGVRIGRSNLALTHLFFADDNILFRDASMEGARAIKAIINEYEGV